MPVVSHMIRESSPIFSVSLHGVPRVAASSSADVLKGRTEN